MQQTHTHEEEENTQEGEEANPQEESKRRKTTVKLNKTEKKHDKTTKSGYKPRKQNKKRRNKKTWKQKNMETKKHYILLLKFFSGGVITFTYNAILKSSYSVSKLSIQLVPFLNRCISC